jgi:ABC-type antimicrobial peptide transport system permease subunit
MSHAVQGQSREIGVRLALGATRRGMVARILRSALLLVLPGLALGVGGAVLARHFIQSLLYQVSPLDPLVYGTVLVVFLAAAIAAAAGPARRASRVDVVDILSET